MNDFAQFSILVGLWVGGLGLFTFLFTRLERRMDQLDVDFKDLRRDLAEEFRAQRAEVTAQVSAIASAIIASRGRESTDDLLAVIARLVWRFAKTMPHIPHEYAVRSPPRTRPTTSRCSKRSRRTACASQTDRPGKRRYKNRYFEPGDGWRYWCMTTHMPSSHVINRARIAP